MPDTDKTLKLLIELGVVGEADAQAAEKLLAETKEGAASLSKEMGVLTVSAADAEKILSETGKTAGDAGKALDDSGEKVEKHTGHAREMHHVFGELNRIVPGLGTALKVAFHPDMIGIVGAVIAFEALHRVMEDIKAIDDIKLADFKGDKEAIDAVRQSYEQAQVAAQTFVDEQDRLNHAGLSADDVAKRRIESYKNLTTAQEEFNTAQKKFAEAGVDDQEKKGLITHAEAVKEKFALDVEYTGKKLQLDAQLAADELRIKQQALQTEREQLTRASQDQRTDLANAEHTAAAKAKHDKDIDTAKENIESGKKALEELGKSHGSIVQGIYSDETAQQLEEYYEKYVGDAHGKNHSEMFAGLRDKMTSLTSGAAYNPELVNFVDRTIGKGGDAGWAKFDDAKQQIASQQGLLKKLEESQFKVDLNAERGKKQLEATDEAIRKLSADVEAHTRAIQQAGADAAAKANNASAVANLDLRAEAVKNGLPDPGNPFRATPVPVMSNANAGAATPAPWRYDYSQRPSGPPPSPERRAKSDLQFADHANDLLNAGKQMSQADAQKLQAILQWMTGHAVSQQEILATLHEVFWSQQPRDAAYRRELATLRAQVASSRNTDTGG